VSSGGLRDSVLALADELRERAAALDDDIKAAGDDGDRGISPGHGGGG
jgi:hypothetical protein